VQHLGEADDRVQRCAQLVGHRGQEVRLVLAGDLELSVDTLQLVARAVHPRGEPADLIPVRHLEPLCEVAGADLLEPFLGAAQRGDHGPREDQPEHNREQEAGRADADQEIPRCLERTVVGCDDRVGASAGLAGEPAEVCCQRGRERVCLAENPFHLKCPSALADGRRRVPCDRVEDPVAARDLPGRRRVDCRELERA
jgi:hypothetical protein